MRPPTVVDGGCGKIGAGNAPEHRSSNGGLTAHDPVWIEAAPAAPSSCTRTLRSEVAWHLDAPLLEAPPPQKRIAQEEYRRLPVVCESTLAKEEAFVTQSGISTDAPIPVRPLSEHLIGPVDDAAWARCPDLSSLTRQTKAAQETAWLLQAHTDHFATLPTNQERLYRAIANQWRMRDWLVRNAVTDHEGTETVNGCESNLWDT